MKKIDIILAVLFSAFFTGCSTTKCITGAGKVMQEIRSLEPFNSIVLDGSYDVHISYDSIQKIEVRDYENIIDLLSTTVEDGVLKIGDSYSVGRSEKCISQSKGEIFIAIPLINGINIIGSGNIIIDSFIFKDFKASISGSGDIFFKGNSTAEKFKASISGSGDINAVNLKSNECELKIDGSGDIKVNALKQMKVEISGSGDVYYIGNPVVSSKVSGSGSVMPIE